jgi:hypothetical protein
MALPIARSRDEAHLYLDLHPCERCHRSDVDWQDALTHDDGAPARRYFGVCPGCGEQREFTFRLPEKPALPGPDDLVFFGGPEHSQLFDAGEWRMIADAAIQEGSAPSDSHTRDERRRAFALGVAALGEVLKFIPEGVDAVPESAFWTPHGRAAYEENPRRFERGYLTRWLETFQDEMTARFRD